MTQQVSFVRTEMLPQQAPPSSEMGVVKWVRENLFAGPVNSVLTVLGFSVMVWLVMSIWPWLAASVWNAKTLSECRQIIAERWGEGHHGACWAVVKDRWQQYAFGFYPSHLYWRAILALGLLFFALTPVLFSSSRSMANRVLGVVTIVVLAFVAVAEFRLVDPAAEVQHSVVAVLLTVAVVLALLWAVHLFRPTQMIWFTAIYPGLAFWLLWGGSIWLPVVVMAGFVLGWVGLKAAQPMGGAAQLAMTILLPIVWWLWIAGFALAILDTILPIGLESVGSDKFGGFVLAITIGVAGIALSLPFGIVLALGRQSDMFLVKTLSVCFIEFIRGVPLITLLFTASLLLNYFLPPGTNFDIILRVVIMVTLFSAAYIAEVIRGGLAALPRGQYEAADALGLDYAKAQRLIILPQALKISIPGIVSSFIGMFKDTTLVVFVGLLDPLKGITDIVRASTDWKGIYWEPYIFVAAIFFIFNFSMSRYSMYLERKLKTDHR